MRILVPVGLLLTLALTSTAQAARPAIDPHKAESTARAATREYVDSYADLVAEDAAYIASLSAEDRAELTPDALQPTPRITRWQVEDCDRETRYRALCDWSIDYADGSSDDGTIEVIVTRRGRYIVDAAY